MDGLPLRVTSLISSYLSLREKFDFVVSHVSMVVRDWSGIVAILQTRGCFKTQADAIADMLLYNEPEFYGALPKFDIFSSPAERFRKSADYKSTMLAIKSVITGYLQCLKLPLCKYLPRDMRKPKEYAKFFKAMPSFKLTHAPRSSDPEIEPLVLTLEVDQGDPSLPELARHIGFTDDRILLKLSFENRSAPRYVDLQTGESAVLLMGNDVQMIPVWRIVIGRRVGKVAVWHADTTMTEIIPPRNIGAGAQESFSLAMLTDDRMSLMIKMNNFTTKVEDYKLLAADFRENGKVLTVERHDWEKLAFSRMSYPSEWQLFLVGEPTEKKVRLKSVRDKGLFGSFKMEIGRLAHSGGLDFGHLHPRQELLWEICKEMHAGNVKKAWPLIQEFMTGKVFSPTRVEWLIRATIKGEAAALEAPQLQRMATFEVITS